MGHSMAERKHVPLPIIMSLIRREPFTLRAMHCLIKYGNEKVKLGSNLDYAPRYEKCFVMQVYDYECGLCNNSSVYRAQESHRVATSS